MIYELHILFERIEFGIVFQIVTIVTISYIIIYVTIHKNNKMRNRKSTDSSDCLVTGQLISEVPSHIVMFTIT